MLVGGGALTEWLEELDFGTEDECLEDGTDAGLEVAGLDEAGFDDALDDEDLAGIETDFEDDLAETLGMEVVLLETLLEERALLDEALAARTATVSAIRVLRRPKTMAFGRIMVQKEIGYLEDDSLLRINGVAILICL